MMLMTNDVLAAQTFADDTVSSDSSSIKSILQREQRDAMREFSSLVGSAPQCALTVAVEDILVKSTSSDEYVEYQMRVLLDKQSWTLQPHRYSNFEALHNTLKSNASRMSDRAGVMDIELPPKHLVFPTRGAVVQRSIALQRYCCALLSKPDALRSKEVSHQVAYYT